jgi:hypothetical protein
LTIHHELVRVKYPFGSEKRQVIVTFGDDMAVADAVS